MLSNGNEYASVIFIVAKKKKEKADVVCEAVFGPKIPPQFWLGASILPKGNHVHFSRSFPGVIRDGFHSHTPQTKTRAY